MNHIDNMINTIYWIFGIFSYNNYKKYEKPPAILIPDSPRSPSCSPPTRRGFHSLTTP